VAETPRREIRSFVRRAGRTTHAQARAMEELWPIYGIDLADAPLDLNAVFGRSGPRMLEIGFGDGEALAEFAGANPKVDCLGIEVHEPGVGHLLLALEARQLSNVRLICHDAVEILDRWLAPDSLDRAHLFFPDPWPKKRHHKRRIVQASFLDKLARTMRADAMLHMATDWMPYAEHMREVADACVWFDLVDGAADARIRPETKFERRGRRLGHEVRDLFYRRNTLPVTTPVPG